MKNIENDKKCPNIEKPNLFSENNKENKDDESEKSIDHDKIAVIKHTGREITDRKH